MTNGYETDHRGAEDHPYGPYHLEARPEVVNYYLMRAREERSRVFVALLKAALSGLRRLLPWGRLRHARLPDITAGRHTPVAS